MEQRTESEQEEELMHCSLESRGTSNALAHEPGSEFGDESCGEPLLAQHLLIDFTPCEELELDSEYNQKKCRAFWDFINGRPEIQHLMAVPEPVDHGHSIGSDSNSTRSERWSEPWLDNPSLVERTAVSTLELVEKEGVMRPALLALAAQSHCSLGSREYPEPKITLKKATAKPKACTCKGVCELCHRNREKGGRATVAAAAATTAAPARAAAVDLCNKIKKWDADHPKSMEPPGHPPNLCPAGRRYD